MEKKEKSQISTDILAHNVKIACNYLKLLYESNKKKIKIPNVDFNSKFFDTFFEPVEAFKIYLTKSPNFNFINFPFLLNFDYKYKLIQI